MALLKSVVVAFLHLSLKLPKIELFLLRITVICTLLIVKQLFARLLPGSEMRLLLIVVVLTLELAGFGLGHGRGPNV